MCHIQETEPKRGRTNPSHGILDIYVWCISYRETGMEV